MTNTFRYSDAGKKQMSDLAKRAIFAPSIYELALLTPEERKKRIEEYKEKIKG